MPGRPDDERKYAINWLRDRLASGAAPVRDIRKDADAHVGGMSGPRFAGSGWHGGPRNYAWNGGHDAWHGNWHGHDHNNFDHNHFVHNRNFHDHFHNNVFIAGIGWWPGYYGYGYGYGGCGWLYRQAVYSGSPYWWDRYNACIGYGY